MPPSGARIARTAGGWASPRAAPCASSSSATHEIHPPTRAVIIRLRMSEISAEDDRALQRYKLTLAYRGTRYHGWQWQAVTKYYKGPTLDDGQGIPTVQVMVAKAITSV